ncbi:MAG: hypothetical protein LAO55_13845, partial [Acidobacteriia bacterium]|nr:hypothetical protein [Terriglobia bacterium]
PYQRRLLSPMRTPPVVQRGHPDTVLGAILAPPHPALRKSLNEALNLFLAPHPAIFGGFEAREQDGFL